MTKNARMIMIWLSLEACSLPEAHYPPVAGTGCSAQNQCTMTDPSMSTSTSTSTGVAECAAYIGCMKQCSKDNCSELCAEATGSDAATCEQIRCDDLIDSCQQGDAQACADLLGCVDPSSSTTDTTSTSTDTTLTGTSTGTTESSGSTGGSTESSSSSDSTSTSDSSSTAVTFW